MTMESTQYIKTYDDKDDYKIMRILKNVLQCERCH